MYWKTIHTLQPIAFFIYLFCLSGILVQMVRRYKSPLQRGNRQNLWLIWAVAVLILGDTFHLATMTVQMNFHIQIPALPYLERESTWLEVGTFASSLALTVFYGLLLFFVRRREEHPWSFLEATVLGSLLCRLIIILFPASWRIGSGELHRVLRNLPFLAGGVGVGILFLNERQLTSVRPMRWLSFAGWSILLSFVFYLGSLLIIDNTPFVWLQMAAKSICYLCVAFSLYKSQFTNIISEGQRQRTYSG